MNESYRELMKPNAPQEMTVAGFEKALKKYFSDMIWYEEDPQAVDRQRLFAGYSKDFAAQSRARKEYIESLSDRLEDQRVSLWALSGQIDKAEQKNAYNQRFLGRTAEDLRKKNQSQKELDRLIEERNDRMLRYGQDWELREGVQKGSIPSPKYSSEQYALKWRDQGFLSPSTPDTTVVRVNEKQVLALLTAKHVVSLKNYEGVVLHFLNEFVSRPVENDSRNEIFIRFYRSEFQNIALLSKPQFLLKVFNLAFESGNAPIASMIMAVVDQSTLTQRQELLKQFVYRIMNEPFPKLHLRHYDLHLLAQSLSYLRAKDIKPRWVARFREDVSDNIPATLYDTLAVVDQFLSELSVLSAVEPEVFAKFFVESILPDYIERIAASISDYSFDQHDLAKGIQKNKKLKALYDLAVKHSEEFGGTKFSAKADVPARNRLYYQWFEENFKPVCKGALTHRKNLLPSAQ